MEFIKRELTVGDHHYIPVDDVTRSEAAEWVAEQERKKWWPWITANIGTPAAIISAVAGTIALIMLLINTGALHKRWAEEDEAKKPRVRLQSNANLVAGQFRELYIGLEPQPPESQSKWLSRPDQRWDLSMGDRRRACNSITSSTVTCTVYSTNSRNRGKFQNRKFQQ